MLRMTVIFSLRGNIVGDFEGKMHVLAEILGGVRANFSESRRSEATG